jgi:hypothetical protein
LVSAGFEFRTSALISNASRSLARINTSCALGKDEVTLGYADDLLHGTHTWEVTRVDTMDDFSCLESYLDQDGKLAMSLWIVVID